MRHPDHLRQTLPEPNRPNSLPKKAQWLSGEGAGSWFMIEENQNKHFFEVTRFSPKGKVECRDLFKIEQSNQKLDLNQNYQFLHLSHCAEVRIKQNDNILKLKAYKA